MDEPKTSRTVIVANQEGFHLRPASLFVGLARKFQARIEVVKDGERADGKSEPLQLLTLGAACGDELLLEASGADAEEALAALAALFANRFEEQPETNREQVRD